MLLGLVMGSLGHLPLPAEAAPPVPIHVQLAREAQGDPEREALVDKLRAAICRESHHVQQVTDASGAEVIFVISDHEVSLGTGNRERHHVTGRFYMKAGDREGEPFGMWADVGTRRGATEGLGRFVESGSRRHLAGGVTAPAA